MHPTSACQRSKLESGEMEGEMEPSHPSKMDMKWDDTSLPYSTGYG